MNNIQNEVKIVTEAIKNDEELYYTYQSNIAMAFKDEYDKCADKDVDIHEIANIAAKNFLDMWIHQGK